jgi:hypothetical protein
VKGAIQTTHTTFIIIWGEFLDFEIDSSSRSITPSLLWDMEEMYGATKRPYLYSKVIGTIELNDFIQEFES